MRQGLIVSLLLAKRVSFVQWTIRGTGWYAYAMSLFCFLWMPLFYLFWRSVTGNTTATGGVWALILGSIIALVHFFLGSMVEPGGFGLSRWLSGCIDIVALPALAPLLVYLVLLSLKIISGTFDFANFSLLWLIPGAAISAVSRSSQNDPILLVLVPLLWAAIAVGIPFFITLILKSKTLVIVLAALAILIVPLAAASSYWAFFSQKTSLGFLFFVIAAMPMLISMGLVIFRPGD